MPVETTEMLTDLDEKAESEIILAQGRTTSAVLGEEGWFKSGRGVRQGSIGGPIKWIVYMNFWLKYVNKKHEEEGYKMSKDSDTVLLAQMYVDDSNWAARTVEGMTQIVKSGSEFVAFHGISFNKKKSEYIVMNQSMREDGWTRPKWPDEEELVESIRVTGRHEERRGHIENMWAESANRTLRRAMLGIPKDAVRSRTAMEWTQMQTELDKEAGQWRLEAERWWWRGEPPPPWIRSPNV